MSTPEPALPAHIGFTPGIIASDRYTLRAIDREGPALFSGQWTPTELRLIAEHMEWKEEEKK